MRAYPNFCLFSGKLQGTLNKIWHVHRVEMGKLFSYLYLLPFQKNSRSSLQISFLRTYLPGVIGEPYGS